MSHEDKKFEDESQDARRHDQHKEVHPNEKRDKHVNPNDKESHENCKK